MQSQPIEIQQNPKTKNHTMWAVSYLTPPTPCHPLIPKPTKPPLSPLGLTVSAAKSKPTAQDLGGLGHSLRTKLKSNPKPTSAGVPKQENQQQKQKLEEGRQISGSEVLFAMQRAAAEKHKKSGKKKKKRKSSSSSSSSSSYVGSQWEGDGVDYSKVRPLCVNTEWGRRLDELEKRLQDLSSKTISF